MTVETIDTVVTEYLACWNETDPAARRERLERAFTADATYVDPLADVAGLDALDATIAAVQEQFADMVFAPLGEPDGHHDVIRFRWGLGAEGAEPVVEGFDVVTTAQDGRIREVRGFLDRLPQ